MYPYLLGLIHWGWGKPVIAVDKYIVHSVNQKVMDQMATTSHNKREYEQMVCIFYWIHCILTQMCNHVWRWRCSFAYVPSWLDGVNIAIYTASEKSGHNPSHWLCKRHSVSGTIHSRYRLSDWETTLRRLSLAKSIPRMIPEYKALKECAVDPIRYAHILNCALFV